MFIGDELDLTQAKLPDGLALSRALAGAEGELASPYAVFCLNPLDVGGQRAWLSLAQSIPTVRAEVHPSANAVEYVLQHDDEWWPIVKQVIDVGRMASVEVVTKALTIDYLVHSSEPERRAFQRLCDLWERQHAVTRALAERGMQNARSAQDLVAIHQAVGFVECTEYHATLQQMLPLLRRVLAER